VRQQGRYLTSRLLILAWMPADAGRSRVGFVVSKRISKLAVKRNLLKRLLSEAVRPLLPELSGAWDIVISARSEAANADLHTLQQDIVTLLRKARLLETARRAEVE